MRQHQFAIISGRLNGRLNGRLVNLNSAKPSPYLHGLHYATTIITGIGGWLMESDRCRRHRGFRWPDHVDRFLANLQAMGYEDQELPTKAEIMTALATIARKNLQDLEDSPDIYLRLFGYEAGQALGVGSTAGLRWGVITRDLTDYLGPKAQTGISLLFPGELFRRTTPFCGVPHLKQSANYALGAFWKGRVVERYDCKEVLALTNTGQDLSETTGSNIFLVKDGAVYTPGLASWCLSGWTRDTAIRLLRHLGLAVIDDRPVPWAWLEEADEVFITGTWSGVVPVTQIKHYPGPAPSEAVFSGHGAGGYQQWLERYFQVREIQAPFSQRGGPGPVTEQVKAAYWAVVRQNRAKIPEGFEVPEDWHVPF